MTELTFHNEINCTLQVNNSEYKILEINYSENIFKMILENMDNTLEECVSYDVFFNFYKKAHHTKQLHYPNTNVIKIISPYIVTKLGNGKSINHADLLVLEHNPNIQHSFTSSLKKISYNTNNHPKYSFSTLQSQ